MSVTALAPPLGPWRSLAWFRRVGSNYGWVTLFLAPFALTFAVFTLYPILATFAFSFFRLAPTGTIHSFAGFSNYQRLFADPVFWQAFWNTIIFVVVNCALKLPISFLLAYLLTRPWLRLRAFFRTVFFLPVVINVALLGIVFEQILNPTAGPLGILLTDLHIGGTQGLLGSAGSAMLTVIVVSVWQIFGQYLVYWMAALQNVPEDLYEAAEVDGAGFWQKIGHVTLPSIRPIAVTITLLAIADAFRVFAIIYTMTPGPGGPGNSTEVLSLYEYQNALGTVNGIPDYGFAAAIGSIFLAIAIVLSIAYAVVNRRQRAGGLFVVTEARP